MQREFPLADARKPELTDKAVEPSSPMEQYLNSMRFTLGWDPRRLLVCFWEEIR
jgi:hypothetical protein